MLLVFIFLCCYIFYASAALTDIKVLQKPNIWTDRQTEEQHDTVVKIFHSGASAVLSSIPVLLRILITCSITASDLGLCMAQV